MRKFALLLIALVAMVLSGCYVVHPQGDDNASGDQDHPWQHVGPSLTKLRPGDTLVITPGTYTENIDVNVTPGTPENPIKVVGQDGAVIKGKLWVEGANYWTFDNVDVNYGASSGDQMVRLIRSHDWHYINSELWGARSTAAFAIGPGQYGFSFDHNYVHDTIPTNGTNQDHLIYVDSDAADGGGVIERNLLVGSPNGRAVKIGKGSGATTPTGGLIVRYNTMVDNLGPSNVQLSYGAANNQIYRNIFVHSGSGFDNVTRFNLAGTGSVAHDNIGWLSTGVIDAGPGLTDTGGNLFLDPQLDSTWHPQNPAAQDYGRYAP